MNRSPTSSSFLCACKSSSLSACQRRCLSSCCSKNCCLSRSNSARCASIRSQRISLSRSLWTIKLIFQHMAHKTVTEVTCNLHCRLFVVTLVLYWSFSEQVEVHAPEKNLVPDGDRTSVVKDFSAPRKWFHDQIGLSIMDNARRSCHSTHVYKPLERTVCTSQYISMCLIQTLLLSVDRRYLRECAGV